MLGLSLTKNKNPKEGAFMVKSIQHFQTEGVKKLEDIFVSYSSNLSKIAEMVEGVTKSVVELGCSMIAEEWEFYDAVLRERRNLRPDWEIIRRNPITRLTSLGEVTYFRTYFKNKKTGERRYLLDTLIGFEKNEYLTEDAIAREVTKLQIVVIAKVGQMHASPVLLLVRKLLWKNFIHYVFRCLRLLMKKSQSKLYI